ncbi:hypothetical protein CSC94_01980 [Zhengella mangrovi]|uniref:EamA domain-containing protein n=1 Tax=Zhengella mangrovi TaxID=1982044 RepID=A0A2G1QTK0_9HYPH|nr:DMT family transporter [Zhengella mangrovi]PHP68789.1 hypothetical protein CSC94_01980 [Zhengella mangrovi]
MTASSVHCVSRSPALPLLVLAPVLWGGNFVVGRFISPDIPAFWLNFSRWIVAAVVLLPIGLAGLVRERHALKADFWKLCLLSMLGVVTFNTLIYSALKVVGVTEVIIGFAMSPLVILSVLAIVERRMPSPRVLSAVVLSMAGVLVAEGESVDLAAYSSEAGALALVLAATLVWSFYCLSLSKLPLAASPLSAFLSQILIGLTVQAIFALTVVPAFDPGTISRAGWASILYLGVFASAVAFLAWQAGLRAAGPQRSSVFLNLVPLSGLVLASFFLGERVSLMETFGLVLIFTGVGIVCLQGSPGVLRQDRLETALKRGS